MERSDRRPLEIVGEDTNASEITAVFDSLGASATLALDTESDSFHRYREKVCLIQISTEDRDILFDPLAHGLPDALRGLMTDEGRTWLLHGGDFDVLSLRRDFDVVLGRVFDTGLAARFLGRKAIGLASMLDSELGIHIGKGEQRSDWARRPLSPKQIDYARQDTAHLHALAGCVREELSRLGRLAWVEEECELLRHRVPNPRVFDPDGWLSIKGVKTLSPPGRRAARAAYLWREARAKKLDRAQFRVLGNEAIKGLGSAVDRDGLRALQDPRSVKGMPRRGPPPGLMKAVRDGVQAKAPVPDRKPRKPKDGREGPPADKERVGRLRALRTQLSESTGLEPGLLLPNALCEKLVLASPKSTEALAAVPGMTRWRVEVAGESLLVNVT